MFVDGSNEHLLEDDSSCSLRIASFFCSFPRPPTEVRESLGICHPRAGRETTPYLTPNLSSGWDKKAIFKWMFRENLCTWSALF